MANQKFSKGQITKLAQEHMTTKDDITRVVTRVETEVDTLEQSSGNQMTQQLQKTFQDWRDRVQKDVFTQLEGMSDAMTKQAKEMEETDTQNRENLAKVGGEGGGGSGSPVAQYLAG